MADTVYTIWFLEERHQLILWVGEKGLDHTLVLTCHKEHAAYLPKGRL